MLKVDWVETKGQIEAATRGPRITRRSQWIVLGVAGLIAGAATTAGIGQNTPSSPSRPKITLLSPEANRPPDANEQMQMRQKNAKKQDFDTVNALRIKQINDDATKLLILTRDLNEKMSKLGKEPMPPNLVREAEVIEMLAHDVEQKMTLTVGAS